MAGLFLGFSLVSLAEILYFFAVNPIILWIEKNLVIVHNRSTRVGPLEDDSKRPIWLFDYIGTAIRMSTMSSFKYAITEHSKIAK